MNWTVRAQAFGCAIAILALSACGTGPAPSDVSEGVGFQDYQQYQARREALQTPGPVAPQTALPPAEVVAEPFANAPSASSTWVAADPVATGAPGAGGSADVASIAAGAIAEAESGMSSAPAPARELATAPVGDDFVAPPLPEGMSVVGATVVAFALTTEHAVGERVWSRFPLRLGRPEVRCGDFRTTDLAQDWFLTNEGPERDPAGLDPDGDGFACNWSPERYRAEARAATMPATPAAPATFGTPQDG